MSVIFQTPSTCTLGSCVAKLACQLQRVIELNGRRRRFVAVPRRLGALNQGLDLVRETDLGGVEQLASCPTAAAISP